jgi:hypothetical protein
MSAIPVLPTDEQQRSKPDPDYVTGKVVVEYQLPCRLARWDDMRCGPEARYWEQRTD